MGMNWTSLIYLKGRFYRPVEPGDLPKYIGKNWSLLITSGSSMEEQWIFSRSKAVSSKVHCNTETVILGFSCFSLAYSVATQFPLLSVTRVRMLWRLMMSTQSVVCDNQQRFSLKWVHPGVRRVWLGAVIVTKITYWPREPPRRTDVAGRPNTL